MTEAARRQQEILDVKREAERRFDMQLGDHPNKGAYVDSLATFLLARANSLIALELNRLNLFLRNRESSDPFDK